MFKLFRNKFGVLGLILVIFIGVFVWFSSRDDSNFKSLSYTELVTKIDNGESFVLCATQTTCIHCSEFKPTLKAVSEEYNVDIFYIEIDLLSSSEREEFNNNFSVNSTPTTLFIKNGKEESTMNRLVGLVSEASFVKKLKKEGFIS